MYQEPLYRVRRYAKRPFKQASDGQAAKLTVVSISPEARTSLAAYTREEPDLTMRKAAEAPCSSSYVEAPVFILLYDYIVDMVLLSR